MKKIITTIISIVCLWGISQISVAAERLPDNIRWITNDSEPIFADLNAQKGGTYTTFMLSFPVTLRFVGPDSNSSFRSFVLDNFLPLIMRHPNTDKHIPVLATHWAYGADKKSMYFKINPKARWSDGKPVTADDFVYVLEFMRSEHIIAPWYNDYYTKEFDRVVKFDDHTIKVVLTKPVPDIEDACNMMPLPKHFFGTLAPGFPKKYDWVVVPNNGPYQISKIRKGKSVTFERVKDWWAKDLKYFQGRFNVDRVVVRVIRDMSVAFEHFRKRRIDSFPVMMPEYWHDKTNVPEVNNGHIHRLWFYTDTRSPAQGMWLNQANDILRDRNVRIALAHAMNFDIILRTLLRGDFERLNQHYEGYGEYTNPKIKAREFNLAKAEEYFRLAGWGQRGPDGIRVRDGRRLSFVLSYGSSTHTPRLVLLREEAIKAGVDLRLQLLDATASYKKTMEKNHDIAWMGWSTGFRPAYWEHYHSDNANRTQTNNITNTADPELDRMIIQYRFYKRSRKNCFEHEDTAKATRYSSVYPIFQNPVL
jgi:microcin C transport system substrate-binding protein